MPALVRKSALVVLCILMTGSGIAQAEGLDTSKLPRSTGAKEIFANASSTIYTAPGNVTQTAEAVRTLLRANGWQQFAPNASALPATAEMQIATFRKGPQALSVMVNVAPAQNNATSVNYTATLMRHDLPFPADATDIVFDPDRPTLSLMTRNSVEQTLAFFRTELAARGWSRWTSKGGKQTDMGGPAGEITDHGAFSYYVRDNGQPVILLLQRKPDDRLRAEIKPVPPSLLNALVADKPEPPKPQPVAAAPAPQRTAADDAIDAALKDALSGASAAISQAMKDINKPAPKAAAANVQVAQAETPLQASTEVKAAIPVPEGATDVEIDAEDGKLEFESTDSVRAVANFYRNALKAAGWRERPSVINRPNMAKLDFSKGDKDISMTIMQMGTSTNVMANGTGLVDEAAAAAAIASAPVEEIEGEDKDGLPIPKKRASSGVEKTPLRRELTVTAESNIKNVLAFYRRELTKLNWKEETAGAVEKPDQVVLAFVAPQGPALLKLNAKGTNTEVVLSVRDRVAAEKSGMLPKAGQAKVLFGNINESEAAVTINKQTVKIAAGVGAKAPDGPSIELPPGKYRFSFRIGKGGAKNDEVEVKAGEVWGLLAGPGGILALQVY